MSCLKSTDCRCGRYDDCSSSPGHRASFSPTLYDVLVPPNRVSFVTTRYASQLIFTVSEVSRFSGARTNLKVGDTRPAQRAGKISVVPSTFLALQVQLVVLASAFVMVSTIWSFFVCFSSAHSASRAQLFLKWGGGHVPLRPYGVGATV